MLLCGVVCVVLFWSCVSYFVVLCVVVLWCYLCSVVLVLCELYV